MNETKLIDFDKETLSEMSYVIAGRIAFLQELIEEKWSPANRLEIQIRIDRAMEFRTQLLHAFSVVKERERVVSN